MSRHAEVLPSPGATSLEALLEAERGLDERRAEARRAASQRIAQARLDAEVEEARLDDQLAAELAALERRAAEESARELAAIRGGDEREAARFDGVTEAVVRQLAAWVVRRATG